MNTPHQDALIVAKLEDTIAEIGATIAGLKGQRTQGEPDAKTERAFGDYSPGRWAWLLADVKPLTTPIPARGALGLWNWEAPIGGEV